MNKIGVMNGISKIVTMTGSDNKMKGEKVGLNGVGGTGYKIYNLFQDLKLPNEPMEEYKPIEGHNEIILFPHDINQNQLHEEMKNKSTNQNNNEHLKKQPDAKITPEESQKWNAFVTTARPKLEEIINLKRKCEPDNQTNLPMKKRIKLEETEEKAKYVNNEYNEQFNKITVKQEEVEAKEECVNDEYHEQPNEITIKVEEKETPKLYDHTGPILRSATDPSKSVLNEAEGPIDRIQASTWGSLDKELGHLNKQEIKQIKKQITMDVRAWLATECTPQYAEKFNELMHVAIPLDDGPYRGASCFANKDMRIGTVLGIYGGILHPTKDSLLKEMEELGESKVKAYLFQTKSKQRTVSATEGKSSNMLRLMNTAELPGAEKYKENNVISVRFGNNINVYITIKPIEEGEELLADYGVDY